MAIRVFALCLVAFALQACSSKSDGGGGNNGGVLGGGGGGGGNAPAGKASRGICYSNPIQEYFACETLYSATDIPADQIAQECRIAGGQVVAACPRQNPLVRCRLELPNGNVMDTETFAPENLKEAITGGCTQQGGKVY